MFIKMYFEKEDCIVEVDLSYYVRGVKNSELVPVTFNPYSLSRYAKLVQWTYAKVKPVDLHPLEYTYSDPTDNMKRKRCYAFRGDVTGRLGNSVVEVIDEYGWCGYVYKNNIKYDPDPIITSCRMAMNSAYGIVTKITENRDGWNAVVYSLDEWTRTKNYILNDEKVTKELSNNMNNSKFDIKEVKFNGPATVVFWEDGTKTVVKCGPHDKIDYEKGLAMAITKRALGDNGHYYETIKKYAGEEMTKAENAENQVHDDIWMAYQTLVKTIEDKKATKADLLCAMKEAIGYLDSDDET